MEKDYLDELVEERIATDSEFALAWQVAQLRQRLLELRRQAGMSRKEVAEAMGISPSSVARIERSPGNVSLGRLTKYLAVVGGMLTVELKAPR